MTREEAKEILKAYRNKLSDSVSNQLDKDIDAFNMAIKALEQEPKTGHWINDGDIIGCYYCSECGGYVASYDDVYCKYCGAKMEGYNDYKTAYT